MNIHGRDLSPVYILELRQSTSVKSKSTPDMQAKKKKKGQVPPSLEMVSYTALWWLLLTNMLGLTIIQLVTLFGRRIWPQGIRD